VELAGKIKQNLSARGKKELSWEKGKSGSFPGGKALSANGSLVAGGGESRHDETPPLKKTENSLQGRARKKKSSQSRGKKKKKKKKTTQEEKENVWNQDRRGFTTGGSFHRGGGFPVAENSVKGKLP